MNCFPIPFTPMALQVQFVYRSKIELRNIIVWDWGKYIYQIFLRSSRALIISKIFTRNLLFFIYISLRIIFLTKWAVFSLTRIWRWKICDKHYMCYNKRITTCVRHLSGFKLEHLLYLRILKVLSINKFSNQFYNLS